MYVEISITCRNMHCVYVTRVSAFRLQTTTTKKLTIFIVHRTRRVRSTTEELCVLGIETVYTMYTAYAKVDTTHVHYLQCARSAHD